MAEKEGNTSEALEILDELSDELCAAQALTDVFTTFVDELGALRKETVSYLAFELQARIINSRAIMRRYCRSQSRGAEDAV